MKRKINIEDVVCLAHDLGLLQAEIEDLDVAEAYDELIDRISYHPEEFIESYTLALLNHIQVGTSSLTGQSFKGFGEVLEGGNGVRMFLEAEK